MHIASCIDGRIRIRDHQLMSKKFAETTTQILSALPGVSRISVNSKVGSLLVVYSPATAGLQDIMKTVTGLLGPAEEPLQSSSGGHRPAGNAMPSRCFPPRRAIINIGMLASFSASMAGIVFGVKRLHVAAGTGFISVLGAHLLDKRKTVFVRR